MAAVTRLTACSVMGPAYLQAAVNASTEFTAAKLSGEPMVHTPVVVAFRPPAVDGAASAENPGMPVYRTNWRPYTSIPTKSEAQG